MLTLDLTTPSRVSGREDGIRVSDETVRRVLKRAGIRLSRPQHTISGPDLDYEVKKDD